jgi:hypothetical protein
MAASTMAQTWAAHADQAPGATAGVAVTVNATPVNATPACCHSKLVLHSLPCLSRMTPGTSSRGASKPISPYHPNQPAEGGTAPAVNPCPTAARKATQHVMAYGAWTTTVPFLVISGPRHTASGARAAKGQQLYSTAAQLTRLFMTTELVLKGC